MGKARFIFSSARKIISTRIPMELVSPRTLHVLRNPVVFARQVLKAFRANQGMLLAGAVAFYALLSIVPLLILMVIALSQVINQDVLLAALRRALEYLVPGEGRAVVRELKAFLDHRTVIDWVLLITMLFFSSLGFKVLENAMFVIFRHRVQKRRRHFLVSLVLPFGYIIFIRSDHDAVLQLAWLQGIGERDVCDLSAPRAEAQEALPRFPGVALRLHHFYPIGSRCCSSARLASRYWRTRCL